MYELVGIRNVNFTGSDGRQVSGANLYFTYVDSQTEGVATEKVFIGSERMMKLSFLPKVGCTCDLRWNKYGRVSDIVQA